MKKFSLLALLVSIFCLSSGCSLWRELNTPPKKKAAPVKQSPEANTYKPEVLPDGTTAGLNEYEMEYVKDINKSFRERQKENSKKVFGGLSR